MNCQALRDQLADIYVASIPFLTLNILWIVVSLPIITIIPATAALLYATNRIAHEEAGGASVFFEGLRKWFWRSYLWGGLNLLVAVVLIGNLIFYTSIHENWAAAATAVVICLLIVWLLLQLSTFPLMLEQEQPSLRIALRNSYVIVLNRPLRTLGYLLLIAVIVVVTTFFVQPAWIFITASACAYLANRATLNAVRAIRSSAPPTADET